MARIAEILADLWRWQDQVDMVLINVYSGNAFILAEIASWCATRLELPIVLMLHGGNLPDFSRKHPRRVRLVLKRGHGLVAPSPYLSTTIARGQQVRIIPNVVELDQYFFRLREQLSPRFLWMRTFEEVYDPGMAVKVFAQLKNRYPLSCLTMAGQDHGLLREIRELTQSLGVEESVRFVGFLNSIEKQREFAAHDIFLNTNRVDNMPVSLLEAAACGLPIVTTEAGGIPYMFKHEHDALMAPIGNVEAMVNEVTRLIEDKKLASHLSVNGRTLVEACAWPTVKVLWEDIFADVIQQCGRRKK
jgi:glycosyltransferase involved in cell wall biosynthesis